MNHTINNKKEKESINIVFNYSDITLTNDMNKVLNRGLNFCLTPQSLDKTQVLVDFKRFERTMIWREYWHSKNDDNNDNLEYKAPIFKTEKNNLPKKYKTPNSLKAFLSSVKSDLTDPLNRNKCDPNVTSDEYKALKELSKLQSERKIVIKPCDKGAGLIILNFDEYVRACQSHLDMILENDNEHLPYYEKVSIDKLNEAKTAITLLLEEALDNDIINRDEFQAMDPADKNPCKFYCTFKVHKKHMEGTAPPERPIISGSGSITENIGKFVDYHIKSHGSTHPSFLKDTPHFLRFVKHINNNETLPENTILVTMDVKALYTNIPHFEGIQCVREALDDKSTSDIPNEFIIRMLEIVLKHNIFEFKNQLYKQLIGAAMGASPIPPYANIFMARRLDENIENIFNKYDNKNSALKLFKRFLDDLFFIFIGESKVLHQIHDEINMIHPFIKFTMSHTSINEEEPCDCSRVKEIPFLDVNLSVKEGKINTDLYKKPTDRNMYLLTSSCHPLSNFSSIPYSLALRIIRICSDPVQRDLRLKELKVMLKEREYDDMTIDAAIARALTIPRSKALQEKKKRKQTSRPVFAVNFDPRLPDIPKLLNKHWRSSSSTDQYFSEVFPEPPLTAFKRPRNIRSYIIRAKLYNKGDRPKRFSNGVQPCNKPCSTCPFVLQGKEIKNEYFSWKIRSNFSCDTSNIIYMIKCKKDRCNALYIGESQNKLRERFSQHKSDIVNKKYVNPVSEHFNQAGHYISDLHITVIEKVKNNNTQYRKEREHFFINKFNTYYKGLNKMP